MADVDDRLAYLEQYRELKPRYADLAAKIGQLVRDLTTSLKIHVVTARPKDEDSFFEKASRRDSESKKYIYSNPLVEIEDLAGVRAICYSNSQVAEVAEIIAEQFTVHEVVDKAAELRDEGKVGYVSIHYIVSINDARRDLPEYAELKDLKCELQIRTMFQHAWAEVEHRLQYKGSSPHKELASRFQALAGLVQIADREFDALFALDRSVSTAVENALSAIQPPEPDEVPQAKGSRKLGEVASMYGMSPSVLASRGEYDKALHVYNELINVQPNQAWHYVGKAKTLARKGDFAQAEEVLKQLEGLNSTDARIEQAIRTIRTDVILDILRGRSPPSSPVEA